MSARPLPEIQLAPLRTALLRDLIFAPELERFLAARDLEPAVLDEPEALAVRLARGVEILEERIRTARRAARLRFHWTLAGVGTHAGGILAAALAAGRYPLAVAAAALVLVPSLGALLAVGQRLRRDQALLRRLEGRYRRALEGSRHGRGELLELSRAIYAEACTLAERQGAVPAG